MAELAWKNSLLLRGALIAIICLTLLVQVPSHFRHQVKRKTAKIRDLQWRDINFLHTTDTHGWYSGHINQKQYNANWGDLVAFTQHLRAVANGQNRDFLVVDTGDRHDGNGLTDVTSPNGAKALPIFIKEDYDLITLGNHELYLWENSRQEVEVVIDQFQAHYVSTNVEVKLENGTYAPFGSKYRYFTTPNQKVRILSFAFLFNFNRNNDRTKVTPIAEVIEQDWFLEVLKQHPADSVDLLVVFGHIPVAHSWKELTQLHAFLRKHYPTLKIQYFGGHSHIRDFTVFDSNLTGLQSGRFCETLGFVSIDLHQENDNAFDAFSRSYIDFNLDSFVHHAGVRSLDEFNTAKGNEVADLIKSTRKELHLEKILGHIKHSNYYMDYVPIDNSKSIFRLLTEKILPTLRPTNQNATYSPNRIIIINTGSIRYDLYKGPYTIDQQYIVSPFQNDWSKVTLPKAVALQIAKTLNDYRYIVSEAGQAPAVDNRRLLPLHHYSRLLKDEGRSLVSSDVQKVFQYPKFEEYMSEDGDFHAMKSRKLTKGYVTYDDFGHDGDDTPHKPVVNFPVPNVVEAVQVAHQEEDSVDVVFYDFISPNILWALNELKYEEEVAIEPYSGIYLGKLLTDYIRSEGL